jgi:hypothetical protein
LRLLVVFVPRTSSTPVATWFWQTEGRSAERVILGVRPSEFILLEFQSPSRRILSAPIHSPLSGRLISPSLSLHPPSSLPPLSSLPMLCCGTALPPSPAHRPPTRLPASRPDHSATAALLPPVRQYESARLQLGHGSTCDR